MIITCIPYLEICGILYYLLSGRQLYWGDVVVQFCFGDYCMSVLSCILPAPKAIKFIRYYGMTSRQLVLVFSILPHCTSQIETPSQYQAGCDTHLRVWHRDKNIWWILEGQRYPWDTGMLPPQWAHLHCTLLHLDSSWMWRYSWDLSSANFFVMKIFMKHCCQPAQQSLKLWEKFRGLRDRKLFIGWFSMWPTDVYDPHANLNKSTPKTSMHRIIIVWINFYCLKMPRMR